MSFIWKAFTKFSFHLWFGLISYGFGWSMDGLLLVAPQSTNYLLNSDQSDMVSMRLDELVGLTLKPIPRREKDLPLRISKDKSP